MRRGVVAQLGRDLSFTSVDSTVGGYGLQMIQAQGPFPASNFTFYAQFKLYEFEPGQEYQSLLMMNQYNALPNTDSLANPQLYFHTPTQNFVGGCFDMVSPHETHPIATKEELGDQWFAAAFSCDVAGDGNTVLRWKKSTAPNGAAWEQLDYNPGTVLKARGPMQQAWVLAGAGGESPKGALAVQAFIAHEVLSDERLDSVRNFRNVLEWASFYGITINRFFPLNDIDTAPIDLANGYNANPNGTGATSNDSPFR